MVVSGNFYYRRLESLLDCLSGPKAEDASQPSNDDFFPAVQSFVNVFWANA
jgi:hypothetical protein